MVLNMLIAADGVYPLPQFAQQLELLQAKLIQRRRRINLKNQSQTSVEQFGLDSLS